ncbi:hypothetical protein ACP3TM_08595 [Staphylococcus sp. IPLA37010]|uniref:Right handed beta helix domain-containing protein n=1 Tax=Staphylococcus equorum TaxID=246432 RepID=A0AAW7ALS1_9STAP|nr:hypothetical protein [Staphylococcus equorum]MDK9867028.1 hypothetical protein [Staphylococcus equorum]
MKLKTDLDLELSQGYRQKNIKNFVTIESFYNQLSDELKNHVNGKHVHKAINIDYNHISTVKDRLDWLLVLIRNIVENNNGDGIIEVSDARVTVDGQKKTTLRERIDYEVEKLSRVASYENGGLMTSEDRLELDSYITINPLLLERDTNRNQDIAPLIQKAIDKVGPNGSTILIPDGNYTWSRTVDLTSNVKIRFGLGARIVKNYKGDLFFGSSYGEQGYDAGITNVHIEGGRFVGDLEKGYDLITTLHHSSNATFRNMVFYESSSTHTFDLLGCENIDFDSCAFIGYRLTNNTNHKEAIQLDHSYRQGGGAKEDISSYDGLPTRKITINKCKFLPIKDDKGKVKYPAPNIVGQHRSIIGNNPSYVKITNNVMRDGVGMAKNNEWLGGWIHFRGINHLEITGNEFNAYNTIGYARAIQLYRTTSNLMMEDITKSSPRITLSVPEPLDNVIIKDNVFKNFKSTTDKSVINVNGARFDGKDYFCRFIQISNNNFEWNAPSNSVTANNVGQTLITAELMRHSSVVDNACRISKTFIEIGDCNSVAINSNNFEQMKHTNIIVSSTKKQGLNRLISINDNRSLNSTTFLWFDRTDAISIANNQVSGLVGIGNTGLSSVIAASEEVYKVMINNNSIDVKDKPYIGIRLTGEKTNAVIQGNIIANTKNDIAFRSTAHVLSVNNWTWD